MSLVSFRSGEPVWAVRSHRDAHMLTATCAGLIAASVLAAAIASSYIPLCSLHLRYNRASLLIPKVSDPPNFKGEEYLQRARLSFSSRFQERLEGTPFLDEVPAPNAARVPVPRPRPSRLIAQRQSEQDGFFHTLSRMIVARTVYASLKDRP